MVILYSNLINSSSKQVCKFWKIFYYETICLIFCFKSTRNFSGLHAAAEIVSLFY
jgi:hypothetical protein